MSQSLLMVQAAGFAAPGPSANAPASMRPGFGTALGQAESKAGTPGDKVAATQTAAVPAQPSGDQSNAKQAPAKDSHASADQKDVPAETPVTQTPLAMLQVMLPNVIQPVALPAPVPPASVPSVLVPSTPVQSVGAQPVVAKQLDVAAALASAPQSPASIPTPQAAIATALAPTSAPTSATNGATATPLEAKSQPSPLAGNDAKPSLGQLASLVAQAVKQPADSKDSGKDSPSQDQASRQPKAPSAPVSSEPVPQSLSSLKASADLTSLKPNVVSIQAPSVPHPTLSIKPLPTPDASAIAEPSAPVSEKSEQPVQPWQLPHPIQMPDVMAPQARVLDQNGGAGDPKPLREVVQAHITQAATDAKGPSELRLQLSPENLGRMEIRVMAHEGTVSAQIRVDHAEARTMVQSQLADLKQNLADQGIKIDRLEVNVGGDQQRQQPGLNLGAGMQQQMNQQQHQHQAFQSAGKGLGRYQDGGFEPEEEALDGVRPLSLSGASAVDYQA